MNDKPRSGKPASSSKRAAKAQPTAAAPRRGKAKQSAASDEHGSDAQHIYAATSAKTKQDAATAAQDSIADRASSRDANGSEPLIVAIGASAGGLEAFKTFFAHMPSDNEMAFVLVQHLAPQHVSLLAELLGRGTDMPVQEATDGERLQARHVYVIPPDATLTVSDGHLRVTKPAPPRQHRWPIDALFTSLAEEHGDHAVCVVLAGSGSDGARGLRVVKEHGGLTLAQAGFDHVAMTGMPASAAATGLVDQVMPVEDMPARLLAHQRHLHAVRDKQGADGTREDVAANLQTLCNLLRAETGHDFSQYKEKTLIRRIQRRMQVTQAANVPDYIAYLREHDDEYERLFHELLINVTEFFRDSAAFEALALQAIPQMLAGKNATDTLRVWVPGCATGEEAYSIAIALKEAMPDSLSQPKVLIFATDIDDRAIGAARAGRYRAPLHGISAQRRERWFVEDGDDFCVVKAIREMCVFSAHSVVKDPPFSRIDLISCRNLLIYLNADVQQRLVRIFHYALRPGGFLLLGPSESISRNGKLFNALDKKYRLYARSDIDMHGLPEMPSSRAGHRAVRTRTDVVRFAGEDALDRGARRAVEKYAPAYVVIDEHCDIVRFAGDTGKYLGPSSGAASLNLFALLHKNLRNAARQAVNQARAGGKPVIVERTVDVHGSRRQPLRLVVEPLPEPDEHRRDGDSRLCVVMFVGLQSAADGEAGGQTGGGAASARLHALEHELETTRTQLQSAVDQEEAAVEELKSANEEYQSVNEELQSSNEELETSKEEMQSINEELQTVNTELNSKNEMLARLNSDLRNLLESTRIATLFLDEHLHIRGFTPALREVFKLRESDRGRPITEIAPSIAYPELRADVKQVLRDLGTVERVLRAGDDDPVYLLRVRPYRTIDNVIDGVVLTFVDVTASQKLHHEHARLAAIVNASKDAIFGISLEDRITSWNPSAERLFGLPAAQMIGQPLAALLPAEAAREVTEFFASAEREQRLGEFQMTWVRADGTRVPLEMNWAPVRDDDGKLIASKIIARDISERERAAHSSALMMRELDHRVKNTLATVQAIAQQSLARADDLEDFSESFMTRMLALSKTHNLLAREAWSGADLPDLVRNELAPYLGRDIQRVEISGEVVRLTPKAALALGMALHELSTNAVKYGALSNAAGKIKVDWTTRPQDGQPWLHLRWTEHNGPSVTRPEKLGFGHRLITDGLAFELDGKVELEFAPDGVVCTITLPALHSIQDKDEIS